MKETILILSLISIAINLVIVAADVPSVPLYNAARVGQTMPAIGLGTFGYGLPDGSNGECWNDTVGEAAVTQYLKLGGRRIDGALMYKSQHGVGRAIAASGIPRNQLFITSKILPGSYDYTLQNFETVLSELQVTYVDLLLIHWPGPCFNASLAPRDCRQQTWEAFTALYNQNKALAIGVSNFEIDHIQDIMDLRGLLPAVNQVEFHAYWHEIALVNFCKAHNITMQAYAPLGAPDHMAFHRDKWPVLITEQPQLPRIAAAHGKTLGQVILQWTWQQGITISARTLNSTHMLENLNMFDFSLTTDEMNAISNLPNTPPMGKNKVCPDPNNIP